MRFRGLGIYRERLPGGRIRNKALTMWSFVGRSLTGQADLEGFRGLAANAAHKGLVTCSPAESTSPSSMPR